MRLFAPGMTLLHRAGLGGLACTLRYIERAQRSCALAEEDLPGAPWPGGPPWNIDEHSITLSFGQPQAAGVYLERLFGIAFGLKDGLIDLPGSYDEVPPTLAVRAELQHGLTLTFLQHWKSRTLAKDRTALSIDPEGDGRPIPVEYRRCAGYRHQAGWNALIHKRTGCLSPGPVKVAGPLNPGAVVRHVGFPKATQIEDVPERILPLYFALVGCLALPINRGMGVLLVPEVKDLREFMFDRPALTPRTARDCRIAGSGDAVLQAMIRVRSRGVAQIGTLAGCYAARFRPTTWASQQKLRVETLMTYGREVARFQPETDTDADRRLSLFEHALAVLPPRVRQTKREKEGRAEKSKGSNGEAEWYWAESRTRPLIADNLAQGNDWFDRFVEVMTDKAKWRAVHFEQQGLHAMTTHLSDHGYEREAALVRAIHSAISFTRREIKRKTQPSNPDGPPTGATKNRQDRYMERVRLDLVNARNADQAHDAICKLFRATPYDNGLKHETWLQLLPLLTDQGTWKKARNLALLALASWGGGHKRAEGAGAENEATEEPANETLDPAIE
jgi:CRISPR-associated protein Cas8a1/Csx13